MSCTQGMSPLLKNLWRFFSIRASFWAFRSSTPSPPSSFDFVTMCHATLALILFVSLAPLHKQCFLYLSTYSLIVTWREKVHIKKVGRAVKTELVSWSFPAWERKREVLTNLLSHLLTKGMKSSTFGLVRPRGLLDRWKGGFQLSTQRLLQDVVTSHWSC